MMQNKKINGEKLSYRPMREAELSDRERYKAYEARDRASALRSAQHHLISEASVERPDFDNLSRWIVTTCRPGSEQTISEELHSARIKSWCPLEKFRTRPRRALKPVEIYRPFFRGYLFVKVVPTPEAFAGVLSASRLNAIMSRDGKPYLMPPRIMDVLMVGMQKRTKIQNDEVKLPFTIGDRMRIVDGPFSSFTAMVRAALPDRWQAEVEVEIFGRMTPMTLDIDSLAYDT
jgi:transcriptional antiterminator NusG